jgi:hypothetical protein
MTGERVTSGNYHQPYRPRPIALIDQVGRRLERFGLGGRRFTVDDLIADARRRSGLHRFDDETFREPLGRLLDSIEREAELTPTGRMITRTRLVGVLENRLRAQALFEKHPEILDEKIVAPVFIVGLQRTGTTMLHRLLSADPGLRSLASWEALNPAPLTRRWPAPMTPHWLAPLTQRLPAPLTPRLLQGKDPRIGRAVLAEKGLGYLAPDFFAIHPVEAEAPEEEVILLDYSFLSTVAEATLHVPSYATWLESQDQTPAYRYLHKMLRLLQWQAGGDRWILKTPHHLEWLDTLLAVFPDARVVQTHRDPLRTLASFCSMIAHGRGVFSDRIHPDVVGAHWWRKTQRQVDRAMASRDRAPAGTFLDVSYYDLMADPMAQVQRIYDFIGRRLDAPIRAAMAAARQENPQHKHGTHRYQLADFGLDHGRVDAGFAAYRARHNIPRERDKSDQSDQSAVGPHKETR